MEAIERCAEKREEFKGHIGLQLCSFEAVLVPGAVKGTAAKRIATLPCKCMPIGDRKAQVVFQTFAKDNLVRIVMTECQRIVAVWSFVTYFLDVAEKSGAHHAPPMLMLVTLCSCLLSEWTQRGIKCVVALISFVVRRDQRLFGFNRAGCARRFADRKGSAPLATIRPRRAAPNAAPKSPSSGSETGTFNAVAIDFSQ